ncbi:MAG: trypsin-like serine protease [Caldilineaceae bacterium]
MKRPRLRHISSAERPRRNASTFAAAALRIVTALGIVLVSALPASLTDAAVLPQDAVVQSETATVDAVRLNGPARGFVDEKYRVTALLEPKDAVDTTTFVWSPAPIKGQGTVQALYRWSTPGKHAVKVTATDQTGAVHEADMQIDVVIPETTPATAAAIRVAAATVPVDAPLTAGLIITPTAAANVSIIWSPFPDDGQGKRTATFTWTTAGPKEIDVAVINPDGTTTEARATVEVTPRTPSAGGNTVFLPFLARLAAVTGAQAAAPAIIGGREAVPVHGRGRRRCSSTPTTGAPSLRRRAIDPTWVLTAAHCVVDWNAATTLYVLVGRHDLTSSAGSVVAVTRILVHPQYNDGNSDADIALLQLARPLADTTVSLAPVPVATGDTATVIGWGTTAEGVSSSASDVLMQVDVPIVSTAACVASYGGSITANMLCAGRGGADSCQGDSGGPLMVPPPRPAAGPRSAW